MLRPQPIDDVTGAKSNPSRGRCFFISTAAIAAFLVPFFGVIVITIPAAIVGIIAWYGGHRKWGMTVFIIVAVNIIISPSFWLNLWAGAAGAGTSSSNPNMVFAILDMLSGLAMVPFLFMKRR